MISGWEWIIIIVAVLAILLWGPQKIPELARGIGRARGEFERASREYSQGLPPSETKTSNDDMLILIAKALGINTEGTTREDLFLKVIENIKASKASP